VLVRALKRQKVETDHDEEEGEEGRENKEEAQKRNRGRLKI
jgi:hypothetical protein